MYTMKIKAEIWEEQRNFWLRTILDIHKEFLLNLQKESALKQQKENDCFDFSVDKFRSSIEKFAINLSEHAKVATELSQPASIIAFSTILFKTIGKTNKKFHLLFQHMEVLREFLLLLHTACRQYANKQLSINDFSSFLQGFNVFISNQIRVIENINAGIPEENAQLQPPNKRIRCS